MAKTEKARRKVMDEGSTQTCVLLCTVFLLQTSLIYVCHCSQSEVEIVMPPRSVNATSNSTACFQCRSNMESRTDRDVWSINGSLVSAVSVHRRGNTSEVKVFCSEDQSLSEVTCGLLLVDGSGLSRVNFSASVLEVRCGLFGTNLVPMFDNSTEPALLRIQGLLGPVTNLAVLPTTSTSITLTWDPPFSLNITGVEPDFTHTVEVYNISTDGETELVNTTRNIIDSTFTFSLPDQDEGLLNTFRNVTFCNSTISPLNPDPLDLFQFVVFAVNDGGEGERSDPVNASFSEDAPTTDSPTTIPTTTTTTGKNNTFADGQTTGTVDLPTDCQVPSQTRDSFLVPVTITAFVVGVVLGVVATLLIVLLVTVYTRTRRHANDAQQTASTEEEEIELKRCDAYDVVSKKKKPKRRPVVNPPPVYEEVDL